MPELRCELCRNWESVINPEDVGFKYHGGGTCALSAVPFTIDYSCKPCHDFVKSHIVYRYNSVIGKRIAVHLN